MTGNILNSSGKLKLVGTCHNWKKVVFSLTPVVVGCHRVYTIKIKSHKLLLT